VKTWVASCGVVNRCCVSTVNSGPMESTEKIVEAYVRYVKNWFTIPNIKCKEQLEMESERREATERRQ
jgi:hypothetical protein